MITPNTLTYERSLDMYATAAVSTALNLGTAREHDYQIDLSSGSYAVQAHTFATQLTPERWMDAIRSGSRDTVSHEPAEWELIGAL